MVTGYLSTTPKKIEAFLIFICTAATVRRPNHLAAFVMDKTLYAAWLVLIVKF